MPRLNELQTSYAQACVSSDSVLDLTVEETLVPDRRVCLSTSQLLEDKLRRLTRARRSKSGEQAPHLAGIRP